MVYGGVAWPSQLKGKFSLLGFKDSKQLSEEDREKLLQLIEEFNGKLLSSKSVICTPLDISTRALAREKEGLNTYSHNCAISIIRHFLSQGLNVRRAYLDTVGDEVKYKELLDQTFNQGTEKIEFTVCSKADDLFPVVSAASIVAKVTRDNNVKNTSMKEKVTITTEFGSGYPSDPTTVKWLNDNFQSFFGYPSVVRFSWSTIANRLTDSKLEYTFHANLPEEVHTFQSKPGPNDPKRGKLNLRLHLKNEFAL
jgi:ribonuclease H2 subunit A